MYMERPSRLDGATVWHSETAWHSAQAHVHAVQRILPDGCMDLMWYGDELMVAGPDTTAFVAPAQPGVHHTGLRFAPGTGPAILRTPAYALRDQRVPLADLWPVWQVRRLTDRLHRSGDAGAALEEMAIARDAPPDPVISQVTAGLRAGAPVATIARAFGLSERHLHRRSLAAFGYGPKTLARILRMVRAVRLARAGMPFAVVAATAGYADQAHLARDVKDLAGVPLKMLIT